MLVAERPVEIAGELLSRRIFSPSSYRLVRDRALVPIVHGEALRLAACFPIVWRRGDRGAELVAVRALVDDARAQSIACRDVLPLALQAYPFVYSPWAGSASSRLVDDAIADEPTDVGASITTSDGRPSRACALRLRILDLLADAFTLTHAIGQALAESDLLHPWDLRLEIARRGQATPALLVVPQRAFATGVLSPILDRFGGPAAEVLALHRVSLFRAGVLVAAARTLLGGGEPQPHATGREARAETEDGN